ncbi:MAG: hypothetical protein SH868_15500 [Bythopirellula sp.]|nr:hypothetical protein [Bythopirellula sp.]
MNRRLEIKKGMLGGYSVGYDCPHCSTRLKSPIDDVGLSDTCPNCGREFAVPGKDERDRIRGEQELKDSRRRIEKEQAEQRKQLQSAEKEAERKRAAEEERQSREATVAREPARASVGISQLRRCPYCSEEILSTAQKCKHCGEFLVPTGHSDFAAGCLGLLLGPVGLWYKGHWAAGFAWIAMFFLTMFGTGGFGILLAPVFWIGMAIHAATVNRHSPYGLSLEPIQAPNAPHFIGRPHRASSAW